MYSFSKYFALSTLLALPSFGLESLSETLKNSTISGYAKSMYIFDDRKGIKLDQSTFGIGGKVAFESGSWNGLKTKIAYYRTDDAGTNSKNLKEVDAYMFDVDKKPYSLIGEAYIGYENGKNKVKLGRQEIDTPAITTYDYRIIPNLFEAYSYTNNSLGDTTMTVAYVTKMSGLDGTVSFKDFKSMSEQTYTSLMLNETGRIDTSYDIINVSKISSHQGVMMVGVVVDKNPKFQVWNYYCKDVLNELYGDIAYTYNPKKELLLTIEAQGYMVTSIGRFESFLSSLGLNGSYQLYGAKASLENKEYGSTLSLAYNRFTGNDKTVTVYGNWGGYPEYIGMPFLFAQSNRPSPLPKTQMGKISLKYDLAKSGLAGQDITAGYTRIDTHDQIIADSDIEVINILYKAKLSKKLSARALYELRNSANYRYDNDTLTLSIQYEF
jgi:outer membrane porin, OprD family